MMRSSTTTLAPGRDIGDATAPGTSTTRADASMRVPKRPTFDCNICLDSVSSPVVTLCGHLYCWPCLYQWMSSRSECPVCKAGISEETVIPVYARGSEAVDPRRQMGESPTSGLPPRPRGQRPDPESMRRRRPRNAWDGAATAFASSPTLGFFPAFFSGNFNPQRAPTQRPDGTPLSPLEARQQMQQAFLSRLLLIVGSLVLLCLLTF